MLNAYRRFFAAAIAPLLLNVIADRRARSLAIWLGLDGETVGRLLSWAVLVAGVAQLLWVVHRGAPHRLHGRASAGRG